MTRGSTGIRTPGRRVTCNPQPWVRYLNDSAIASGWQNGMINHKIRHKIIKSFNELWARNPSFTPRQIHSHVYPNWNLSGWNNNHRSEKPFHRGNINYSSKCCLLIWLQVYKTLKDTLLLPWQPMACCLRWTRTIKGRAPNYYDVLKKSLMTFRNVEASSGLYSSPVAPFTNMVYPSMDK